MRSFFSCFTILCLAIIGVACLALGLIKGDMSIMLWYAAGVLVLGWIFIKEPPK